MFFILWFRSTERDGIEQRVRQVVVLLRFPNSCKCTAPRAGRIIFFAFDSEDKHQHWIMNQPELG